MLSVNHQLFTKYSLWLPSFSTWRWVGKALFWGPREVSSVTWASLTAQLVKNLPAMQETQFRSLGRRSPGEGNGNPLQYFCLEDPRESSSILILWKKILLPQKYSEISCVELPLCAHRLTCHLQEGSFYNRFPSLGWNSVHKELKGRVFPQGVFSFAIRGRQCQIHLKQTHPHTDTNTDTSKAMTANLAIRLTEMPSQLCCLITGWL